MKSKDNLHFMKCANSFCGMYHLVKMNEKLTVESMLCPNCREMKKHSHLVQCLTCGSVVDFIPLSINELPGTLYVKQCLVCGGTIDDEMKIVEGWSTEYLVS